MNVGRWYSQSLLATHRYLISRSCLVLLLIFICLLWFSFVFFETGSGILQLALNSRPSFFYPLSAGIICCTTAMPDLISLILDGGGGR